MPGDPVKTLRSSVIVCTHNRSHSLKRALQSLASQTLSAGAFEVVVVDDGSVDATLEVCNTMHEKMKNLVVVSTGKNRGSSSARNVGIGHAGGEYVLFTDDDCIADRTWVECMTSALAHHSIVAGAIESPRDNVAKLCHNIAEFHPFMPGRKPGKRDYIAGANVGFQKCLLDKVGGFEEGRQMASDMELIIRARLEGYQVFFEPRARVIHNPDRFQM
jgi:glycosyltransferase involved in cell wall biosynthesis